MLIVACFILVFSAIQLIVAITNLLYETNLPASPYSFDNSVSVLIPARNEAKNIGNLLEDLLVQDYRNIEIIVFNDMSDDQTSEIVSKYAIRDKRISLLNSSGLPAGWLGKNYACHSLAGHAHGKFLLFLDADVRIKGDVINRAVSFSHKQGLSLISLFPKQVIKTVGEMVTVPNMNYILLSLLPLISVRKTGFSSLSAANGQFMFFDAGAYRNMNPHEALKNDKVEDISIARMFKNNRLKVACLTGGDSVSCRMYEGFHSATAGFSKNVTAFFGNSFLLALLFWIITTLGFIPVFVSLPGSFFWAYLIIYLLTRAAVSLASKQSVVVNLLMVVPLQLSLFLFIFMAFINKYFRKFNWKGRKID